MNIQVTQAAEGLPRRRFTVADCFRLVESGIILPDEKFELLGGELVPMSPKNIIHENLKAWLVRTFNVSAGEDITTYIEPTVHLSEDTFIEPDIVVTQRNPEMEKITANDVLLVIEVANTTLKYDMGAKAKVAARHGIRDYWVINAKTHEAHVHREPGDEGYGAIVTVPKGEALVPAFIDNFQLNLKDFS